MNPAENPHSSEVPAEEVLTALEQTHLVPPSAALRAAADRWHDLRESLLARAEREIDLVRRGRLAEYSDLTLYTLYLAAEKKDAGAFPVLVGLLSVEDVCTVERFGEVFTEDMPLLLSDCYPGEQALPALEAVIVNRALAVACRRAALNALEILAWQQRLSPQTLHGLLDRLSSGAMDPAQPRLWTAFAEVCLAAGLQNFEPVILNAYDHGWMDARSISREKLSAAFAQVRARTYQPFAGPVTIESAAASVESWDWEGPEARGVLSHTRRGRNDPCPCGSGKKFKRCCGGR